MYLFKFEEFVSFLKKTHPRIHPKAIYIPKKYYDWHVAEQQKVSLAPPPSSWWGSYTPPSYIKGTSWNLRKDVWATESEMLFVGYKGKKYYYPVSMLFELEYDNRLNQVLEEDKDEHKDT